MSRRLPIRAKRLIQRQARFEDGTRDDISIFPFFTSVGDVAGLLAADPAHNELRKVPDSALLRLPLWSGRIDVRCGWLDLPPLESFAELSETWHYDPAFVARPMAHPLRNDMLQTNCADAFPWRVYDVYFDAQLEQVKWLFKMASDDTRLIGFKQEHLPDPPAFTDGESERPQGALQWTLTPFWEA